MVASGMSSRGGDAVSDGDGDEERFAAELSSLVWIWAGLVGPLRFFLLHSACVDHDGGRDPFLYYATLRDNLLEAGAFCRKYSTLLIVSSRVAAPLSEAARREVM